MNWVILLVLLPAMLAVLAQRHVRETFKRYAGMPNRVGLTGREAAEKLLVAHGLTDVEIERVDGPLADHYDPTSKRLRLSPDVADRPSVAALGIAAHEVGHAVQHADGYRIHEIRRALAERINRLSPLAGVLLIGGVLMRIPPLTAGAIGFIGLGAVFALVTLPNEINASRRAVDALGQTGLAASTELTEVRKVLRAAALTYVTGLGKRLGLLLFLVAGTLLAQQMA